MTRPETRARTRDAAGCCRDATRSVAHRAAHSCGKALILLFAFLASALVVAPQTPASRSLEIRGHLNKGLACLKANDPEGAVKEFDAVLALDPKNSEAHANLGLLAFARGDCQAASDHFREALKVQPSLTRIQALLGVCAHRSGDSAAQGLLEKAFAKLDDPKLRTQIGFELIALYNEKGQPDRAAPVVVQLVDLNPDNLEILYAAQHVYSELADETLNKMVLLAPGSARMQEVMAQHLINSGNLSAAIAHYRKALEMDPHLSGARFELGEAILQSAPSDAAALAEAETLFQETIAAEGDNANIQCALARIAFARSDLDNAQAHYQRAFTLDPNDVEAQVGLGRVYVGMDKPEEAVKYLLTAVQAEPMNGEAHYRLAMAYKKLQRSEDAQKELHLFQEIKKAKDQLKGMYQQMNKRPQAADEEALPDSPQ